MVRLVTLSRPLWRHHDDLDVRNIRSLVPHVYYVLVDQDLLSYRTDLLEMNNITYMVVRAEVIGKKNQ